MKNWEKFAIGLLLWGATCSACAGNHSLVPTIERPNTRHIAGFHMDSSLVRQAAELFGEAFPNERALCFTGHLTPIPEADSYVVMVLDSVWPAHADSADQYHVFFSGSPRSGCAAPVLAVAHDHTTTPPTALCSHSDPDSWLLWADERLLMSFVFCAHGSGEVLFSDGRRGQFRWASEP